MDFSKPGTKEFWHSFPSRAIPEEVSTRIDVDWLEAEVKSLEDSMTVHERDMAHKAIRQLREGAPAYQIADLPGEIMKNSASITKCGAAFTETLEQWIEDGYVAGPFMEPPLAGFRANSLMAVEQKDKIRLVINMSHPKGRSFNNNVDKQVVGKATMSSARQFGQAVKAAGRGAIMSKMDMKDAYKLVPARCQDYRLQGFYWHGAYVIETQQIFGANTAVENFDIEAKTIWLLAKLRSKIPRQLIHQTLDDTACVGPAGSGWSEEFTRHYREICGQANIRLAQECPLKEKAFTNTMEGTVLGIRFNSEKLAWRLPREKVNDILRDIHLFQTGGHVSLKQTQQLAGRLNNLGQMCPFLKGFRRPLNKLLGKFGDNKWILLQVEPDLVAELRVWAAAACSAATWLPIPDETQLPPLGALEFTSDAAGGTGNQDWAGVASIGHWPSGATKTGQV